MKKGKIGILTTYFATNFGAMLQPFALKRTLEKMGYEVKMIRYKQSNVYKVYKPWNLKRILRKNIIAGLTYLFWGLPISRKKERVFKQYMQKHVERELNFEESIPNDKDFYIFGSDQIWNPKVTGGFDDVYFGNIDVKHGAKKIAYAASAEAIDYSEDQVKYLRLNLSNFNSISVREKSLAEDLKRITCRDDIKTVVDPTVLADSTIYDEIEQINPLEGRRYVLFYKIRDCAYFINKIYDYALNHNCELLILSSWYEFELVWFAKRYKGVTYLPDAGVEIFLGAIKNAECIFTPSFHGCVFPILFHKSFYSLVLSDNWNTRTHDLLNTLGLEDRLLAISDNIVDKEIDYKVVDKVLEQERMASMNYLITALEK